jgi:hypothetical protein
MDVGRLMSIRVDFQGIYKPPKSQMLKFATVSSSVLDEDVEESSFKLRLSWQD